MCDKLTAAALEILAAFEKRLESYEAEIARQRKMLDSFFSPEIKLHRIGKLNSLPAPPNKPLDSLAGPVLSSGTMLLELDYIFLFVRASPWQTDLFDQVLRSRLVSNKQ